MANKPSVFVISLRGVYKKTRVRRANVAMRHLKAAVARKTKTPLESVLIDPSLNQIVWKRGIKKPTAKVTVEVKPDKEKLRVFPEGYKPPVQKEKPKAEAKADAKKGKEPEKKKAAEPKKEEKPKAEVKKQAKPKSEEKKPEAKK